MRYAYQVGPQFAIYPLLGSLVRALGKGWRVLVIVTPQNQELLMKFAAQLQAPAQVTILPEKQLAEIKIALSLGCELVLIDQLANQKMISYRELVAASSKSHLMVIDQDPQLADYDLVSQFSQENLRPNGEWRLIAVTGTGKGKTTSALGLGARQLAEGQSVAVVQWFKERHSGDLTWAINEHNFPQLLTEAETFVFHPTGLGFYGSPQMDRVSANSQTTAEEAYQQHRHQAYRGLELAEKLLRQGKHQLIVLDELIDTVAEIAQNIDYPLIDLDDLRQFLAEARHLAIKSGARLVVTGRRVTADWVEYIDSSVVVTELKHPWSARRQGAISGLDF